MNFHSKSLVAVILVILVFLLGYFIVLPRWSSYKNAKTELSAAQAKQKELEDAQKQLNSFIGEYKNHLQDATTLDNALPLNQDKIYNVLKNLEDLTKSSGLILGELATVEGASTDSLGAAPDTIHPVDVTLSVSGSSVSFRDFIKKLESNLRIIDIQTVNIQNDDTGNNVKYQLKFRTYYQQ